MCDIRLFKSALADYQAAVTLYRTQFQDEMFFNIAAYHLQQCVEKTIKGALECVGVTVPHTHRISKLLQMAVHNGANLTITDWIDDHAEMLGEWEAHHNNMDFLVEKRKIDQAVPEIGRFLKQNGLEEALREELKDAQVKAGLLSCLPEDKRNCSDFEMNCYYLMFAKGLS